MDDESEQIRETYALYGLAMYHASVLETQAGTALSLIEHGDPAVVTRWRFEEAQEEAAALTLGQVVTRLLRSEEISPSLGQKLTEAVTRRNWLAHRYFWDRCVEFVNPQGREVMMTELAELADWFEQLDEELTAVTDGILKAREIAVTADDFDSQLSDLLSGRATPISTRRKLNKKETLVKIYHYRFVDNATGAPTRIPLFRLSDDTFCSLCHCGLTYGPEALDPDFLIPHDEFDDLLPAEVTIKPKGASGWNFRIPLGKAAEICVEPVPTKRGVMHRWFIQRGSGPE